jgi:hypothetical protein
MADIYIMRVTGDTVSHLLLLTSEPGAVLLGRPQFFFVHQSHQFHFALIQCSDSKNDS